MNITNDQWTVAQKNEAWFWQVQHGEGNTEQWHRNREYRGRMFREWFDGRTFRKQTLVDVGSGPAGILHAIRHPCRKIAIDPLMPTYCAQGYDVTVHGIEAICCRCEMLPTGITADVVFCLNMLDHAQDPERCVSEIGRILRTGGELVLCVDMRPADRLDVCHQLPITRGWLRDALTRNALTGKDWDVPHQGENPVVQFCGVFTKGAR